MARFLANVGASRMRDAGPKPGAYQRRAWTRPLGFIELNTGAPGMACKRLSKPTEFESRFSPYRRDTTFDRGEVRDKQTLLPQSYRYRSHADEGLSSKRHGHLAQ